MDRKVWEERIDAIVARYGLESDGEHVIISFTDPAGRRKRLFLLRRPNIIVRRDLERRVTVPLEEVIEALVNAPETPLWESMKLDERMEIPEDAPGTAALAERDPYPDVSEASGRPGPGDKGASKKARPSSTRTRPENG